MIPKSIKLGKCSPWFSYHERRSLLLVRLHDMHSPDTAIDQ